MSLIRRFDKYLDDCRTFPGDAALAYRLSGMQGVWDALAPRTVYRLVRSGHAIVFAQPLDAAPEVLPPPGVVIRRLASHDWPALSGLVMQRDLTKFRALAAAGCHGLVAWRGTQPIGYGWVAERMSPDVSACPLKLPSYAAYLWELYVTPAERCTGVGSALASARVRTARERGFKEGWRMISPSNAASLRTLAKSSIGTRVVGELRFIKVLSRVHARFTPDPSGADRAN